MNEWFEVYGYIPLYGIIFIRKEVLHRRCACRRAFVRPRRAVQRRFRRVMAGRRLTAIRLGEYYFGSDQFDNAEQSGFAELETVAVLNSENGDLVSTTTNTVFIAAATDPYLYDDDGNRAVLAVVGYLPRASRGRNAKLVASRTFQTAASADASAPLAIGSLRGKMGEPQFTGAIADVRVWSKALSPQEVRAAYLQFIGEAIDPSSDDDGDGMPNGWEVENGFDPRDAVDAALDSDGDGMSNLQECRLGCNPRAGVSAAAFSLIKSGTAVGP